MRKPNLLIIGSTGRNTGKTEFACRIIEQHSAQKEIYGVKVIPVDENERDCHRGLEGCGLCNSLTGEFKIIEEGSNDSSKDTARMVNAGAVKAFLLLVERNSMEKGIQALLNMLPLNALIVIESNSVRTVIEPGLFIVIKKSVDHSVKPSCAAVIEFADKIIEFNGMNWDFLPENVWIQNQSWVING